MGFKINAVKNISYVINYYSVLELPEDSSDIEIKKQYKTLAAQYHPDKFQTAGEEIKSLSNKKMTLILEAYQILSNPESKKTYDVLLSKFKKDKPKSISRDKRRIV